MSLSRRQLFASFAAAVAASTTRAHAEPSTLPLHPRRPLVGPGGDVDWNAVRDLFPLRRDVVHFASFYLTSHPRPVAEAIARYRAELDADNLRGGGNAFGAIKQALAAYAGAAPDEFAITNNTTQGLAMVWQGLPLRPGQDVLTTAHDHYSHHMSIRLAAERVGTEVRYVTLYDHGSRADADQVAERLARAIRPTTRAVGVTWVHSSTGVKLPIPRIAEVVAQANRGRAEADRCVLVVDGVHGFGNQDVDLPALGCDFLAAGMHKWLHAPRGTGFVWGRREAWRGLRPTIPTFDGLGGTFNAWVTRGPLAPTDASMVSPGGFLAFEHFLAVPAAVAMHEEIGRANVASRIAHLNGMFRDGVAGMRHVTLHTPQDPALSGGLTAFEVAGMSVGQVTQSLGRAGFRTSGAPYRPSYPRVAAGIMNNEEEVERVVQAVGRMG